MHRVPARVGAAVQRVQTQCVPPRFVPFGRCHRLLQAVFLFGSNHITQRDEDSDHLDESEGEKAPAKKRKTTKVVEAKQKAKAKAAAKKKKGHEDDDYEDSEDEDDDVYTALSRNMVANKAAPPPKPGSFEDCARCEIQFTVVRLASSIRPENVVV